MKMKYVTCANHDTTSKYYRGRQCFDKVLVDENATKAICWKCTTLLVPVEEKKQPTGFPRGWKFMAEFVDKEGNVYHKGELQEQLFGTLPPTEIKEPKPQVKKQKETLDDKVIAEYNKRVTKKTTKPAKKAEETSKPKKEVTPTKKKGGAKKTKKTVVKKTSTKTRKK